MRTPTSDRQQEGGRQHLTKEERRRKQHLRKNRKRKLEGLKPLADPKKEKQRMKRKRLKRRKLRWSKQRRRVKQADGRRKWVKARKAAGTWINFDK